jgi:tRNA pseudouridine55 synthase
MWHGRLAHVHLAKKATGGTPVPPMTPGIHLLHKPEGPTSFSLVQNCIKSMPPRPGRRQLRVCHGGTLDPFASGLLLILVEPATKLFDYLHAIPKVYEATVRWGVETDNGDPGGKVTFTGDPSDLNPSRLEEALATFIGWHDQIPHATSAKRIGGERAYLKAHRGETVDMPSSHVYLHEATWLGHDLPRESRLRITVRGGYYIRALARDLGRMLGCGAHLSQLHRQSIGPWNDPGPDRTVEVHSREIMPWAPVRVLTDMEVGDLRQGREIATGELQPPDWPLPPGFPNPQAPLRGFHLEKFCCLLSPTADKLRLLTAFWGGI